MSPRTAPPTSLQPVRRVFPQCRPQSHASSFRHKIYTGDYSIKSHSRFLALAAASFSTTSQRTAGPNNLTGLTPEQRASGRRMERLDVDARNIEKNFTREWYAGDVYAPHDLSAAEARKWRVRARPSVDAFDALSMNPLDYYKVVDVSKFVRSDANPANRTFPSCRSI